MKFSLEVLGLKQVIEDLQVRRGEQCRLAVAAECKNKPDYLVDISSTCLSLIDVQKLEVGNLRKLDDGRIVGEYCKSCYILLTCEPRFSQWKILEEVKYEV